MKRNLSIEWLQPGSPAAIHYQYPSGCWRVTRVGRSDSESVFADKDHALTVLRDHFEDLCADVEDFEPAVQPQPIQLS